MGPLQRSYGIPLKAFEVPVGLVLGRFKVDMNICRVAGDLVSGHK